LIPELKPFVVSGLFYYKDQQAFAAADRPRGSMACQGCELVPADRDPSRAKFKLRAKEADGSVRLFTLEAADFAEMDRWLGQLKAVQADQVQQMMSGMELQRIAAERDAANLAALQAGVVVSLEPEPEPEQAGPATAPKIAIKMDGQHLAELVNYDATPSLQGWLYKQSGGAVGGEGKKSLGTIRQKEDKRWFVLQHHFIFYFEKMQDFDARNHPKGALPVADAQVADNLSMMDMSQRCTFHVVAEYADGHRKMTLRAESEAETASWLTALRPHVEKITAAAALVAENEDEGGDDENQIYCDGWLAKRSGGKKDDKVTVGELKKSWETRWFVLHHDRITYYKSQQAFLHREKAKATIPIQDMQFERGEKKLFVRFQAIRCCNHV
jgi:hypothetical protein